MLNQQIVRFSLVVLCLGLACHGVHGVANDGFDFYKLVHNPDSELKTEPRLTTADRIAEHGYRVERHYVTTEDGYILSLFRIPYSHTLGNENKTRPIVLIQHGLFLSSDTWLVNGPNEALPFLLADRGYDVWLGNARGNRYSRNHIWQSTKDPKFWRFSWNEIGTFDIAAMIDYALSINPQAENNIHYVGHSQGTTAFFVLMSSRPEYNEKIKTANLLAPVVFLRNTFNPLWRLMAKYLGTQNIYSQLFSSKELLPSENFMSAFLKNVDNARKNATANEILNASLSGASSDQLLHYLQDIKSGKFRRFDFGTRNNLRNYGTQQPPDYETSQITARVHLWYSENDDLVAAADLLPFAATLADKELHLMEDPLWDHMDYLSNWEVRKYINKPITDIIDDYEASNQFVEYQDIEICYT